jgi:hypothetical protein
VEGIAVIGCRLTVVVLGLCGLLFTAAAAPAQSLGDVARREAERRGSTPPAPKTYTNDNLTPDFTKPPAPEPAAAPAADAATAKPEAGKTEVAASSDDEAAKAQEKEDVEKWGVTPRDQQELPPADDHKEEFWRSRSTLIKARLANQNAQVQQLRERMAATRSTNDAERDVLERTFARAEADLKHINDEWVRFERQARERNVPEGWWR